MPSIAPVPVAKGAVPVTLAIVVLLLIVALLARTATTSVGWASLICIVIVEAGWVRVEVDVRVVGFSVNVDGEEGLEMEACAHVKLERERERAESVRRDDDRMIDLGVACVV